MIVFLDSGVLGKLCNPNKQGEAAECENWLFSLLAKSVYIVTSDICDYEVRRSLILESKKKPNINSIESLNELKEIVTFLSLILATAIGVIIISHTIDLRLPQNETPSKKEKPIF